MSDKETGKHSKEVEDLFDWILLHKQSVLDRMSRREQAEFTELFGKARLLKPSQGIKS